MNKENAIELKGMIAKQFENSYTADTLADKGTARRVVYWRGKLWINTGGYSDGSNFDHHELRQVVLLKDFDGTPIKVGEGKSGGNFFYDNSKFKCAGIEYVILPASEETCVVIKIEAKRRKSKVVEKSEDKSPSEKTQQEPQQEERYEQLKLF